MLANVGLDDSGAALLAQAVQECGGHRRRLSLLDLFDNPIGDPGAAALLKAILICTRKMVPQQQQQQQQQQQPLPVEGLDLGLTNISDACADALLAVVNARFPGLRALGLALTDISAEVLQLLEQHSVKHQASPNGSCPVGGIELTPHPPLYHQVSVDIRGTVNLSPASPSVLIITLKCTIRG